MTDQVLYICHPEVVIDAAVPVPRWPLSAEGRAKMARLLADLPLAGLRSVWSSDEQKALDGAEILASHLGLGVHSEPLLGENDRSATGYLVQADFDIAVEAFFGAPEESYRGWETARAARDRIEAAVRDVIHRAPAGDLAIVAHGGVGALLNGVVKGAAISRATASRGYGSWFTFGRHDWQLRRDWQGAR